MLGRRCLSGSKHCSLNLCQCTDVRIIAIFIVCVQTSLVAGTNVGCGTSRPNAMEREDVVHLVIELVGLTKKQQSQRASTRGIFIGIPPKQAGYLIYLEDRIGSAHILVSHDVIFDEDFKSAVAASIQPFQGARLIRPAGTHALEHNFDDANMEHTGSIDDLLHPTIRARGEDNDNIDTSSPDPDEMFDIDEIIDHKTIRGGHYRFRVKWHTGDLTWEPDKYLAQDIPSLFGAYLRRSGLNKLKRFEWANSNDLTSVDSIDATPEQDDLSDQDSDEENEIQQPIESSKRYNLRPRAFLTYESFDNAFDTEPDPVQTAFSMISKGSKDHPVSLFLPEPS